MLATVNPEINVEDLMRRIRQEVAQRKAQIPPALEAAVPWTPYAQTIVALPRLPENRDCIASKSEYTLAELLNYEDDCFIRSAYLAILRREPDPTGYAHYLHMLRTGQLSKAEILGRLRYSPEGKACAVPVRGLLLPFVVQSVYRIPVLGYGVALTNFMLRLPVIIRNRVSFEAHTLRQQREHVAQINVLATQIEGVINKVQQHFGADIEALSAQTSEQLFSLSKVLEVKADNEHLAQLTNHLVELVQRKADAVDLAAAATRLGEELAQKAAVAQVDALATQTEEKVHELAQALQTKASADELAGTATRLGEALAQKADAATTQQATDEIQRQILDHKHNILDQQRRLALLLEEARKRLPEPISTEQIENMVAEEDHLLDAFYVSFEDRFRGTREDIKQRVAIYLPFVKEAKAGTKNAPILDVGCGRGEWLQLLGENDLVARGVDLNRVMISQCQELGLEVVEADAIAYLRNLQANSLGAVTGMHIIEHIPFKRLIGMFDEVLRVLKPGGVAIFETPNPENLQVGACGFYTDPTHLNPLPPHLTEAILELRGFVRPLIVRPGQADRRQYAPQMVPNDLPGATSINPMVEVMRDNFYVSPDYALIAYKAK